MRFDELRYLFLLYRCSDDHWDMSLSVICSFFGLFFPSILINLSAFSHTPHALLSPLHVMYVLLTLPSFAFQSFSLDLSPIFRSFLSCTSSHPLLFPLTSLKSLSPLSLSLSLSQFFIEFISFRQFSRSQSWAAISFHIHFNHSEMSFAPCHVRFILHSSLVSASTQLISPEQ
jgi:hypothetical protein